jgi:hypothetical protein
VNILWIRGLVWLDPVDNHVYNFVRFCLSVSVIAGRTIRVPGALRVRL